MERSEKRSPSATRAGGYSLASGSVLVAVGLALHPLPDHGFHEKASMLQNSPLWGPLHAAIATGFALVFLAVLLILAGGGQSLESWQRALSWGAIGVGLLYFSGTALINAAVMHPIAEGGITSAESVIFDAFNRLLVGFGWMGDPLFLAGLTALAYLELRSPLLGMPRWVTSIGLTSASIAWLRGVGSMGIWVLEPAVLANIPAFLWLAACGVRLAVAESKTTDIRSTLLLKEETA